jgi:hypothetical protein
MPASTSFADWHYQHWNGQPAGSGEPVTGNRRRGPYVATRSAGPFPEAMGELDEQERLL